MAIVQESGDTSTLSFTTPSSLGSSTMGLNQDFSAIDKSEGDPNIPADAKNSPRSQTPLTDALPLVLDASVEPAVNSQDSHSTRVIDTRYVTTTSASGSTTAKMIGILKSRAEDYMVPPSAPPVTAKNLASSSGASDADSTGFVAVGVIPASDSPIPTENTHSEAGTSGPSISQAKPIEKANNGPLTNSEPTSKPPAVTSTNSATSVSSTNNTNKANGVLPNTSAQPQSQTNLPNTLDLKNRRRPNSFAAPHAQRQSLLSTISSSFTNGSRSASTSPNPLNYSPPVNSAPVEGIRKFSLSRFAGSMRNDEQTPVSAAPLSAGSKIRRKDSSGSGSGAENGSISEARRKLYKKKSDGFEVLVGTPIREDHVNYMLMYDMLTGIRISVSRCNSKPERHLTPEDFTARHKLAFDITGNELIPSSRYDFKFKDYAPFVFRQLRALFKIDGQDYLTSLTGKYVLSELGSPGKSGSFFYYSHDYRFIIKTIHHSEHNVLLRMLHSYYEHVQQNPNTLLCRILGLHRVKLPRGNKIHFIVMGNVFPPNKDMHEVYDLKGSTAGRFYDDSKVTSKKERVVYKDKNWLQKAKKLELGPEKKVLFEEQLKKDVAWLRKEKIMDYSLLIGIHDLTKGNKENIRDNTLAVFEPHTEPLQRTLTKRGSKASAIRKAVALSDPVALGPSSSKLPEDAPEERKYCIFYQDEGGCYSRNEHGRLTGSIYYLGVIDIFTYYDTKKRAEHFLRSFMNNRKTISAVDPKFYGERFLKFMMEACIQYPNTAPSTPQPSNANPSTPISATTEPASTPRAPYPPPTRTSSDTPSSSTGDSFLFTVKEEAEERSPTSLEPPQLKPSSMEPDGAIPAKEKNKMSEQTQPSRIDNKEGDDRSTNGPVKVEATSPT